MPKLYFLAVSWTLVAICAGMYTSNPGLTIFLTTLSITHWCAIMIVYMTLYLDGKMP